MAKYEISLSPEELEKYLRTQRTIRLATVGGSGLPHVIPLWFVWVDGLVFMNSTRGNLTLRNVAANPIATGVVDDGEAYDSLRGVILRGKVEWGDQGRLDAVSEAWSRKYLGGNPVPFARWKNRLWFHLVPQDMTSWDFRKIPEARARARAGG